MPKTFSKHVLSWTGRSATSLGHGLELLRTLSPVQTSARQERAKGFVWEAQEMPDEDHGSVVLRSHFGLRKV